VVGTEAGIFGLSLSDTPSPAMPSLEMDGLGVYSLDLDYNNSQIYYTDVSNPAIVSASWTYDDVTRTNLVSSEGECFHPCL